jgi:hypothetical protein
MTVGEGREFGYEAPNRDASVTVLAASDIAY